MTVVKQPVLLQGLTIVNNLLASNEQELLSRVKAARNPQPDAELTEPTAEVEGESVQEVVQEPDVVNTPEALVEDAAPVDESEELYVDYNGREISFSQIDEWEQGSLRQSDYTKKTQSLADERKSFEAEQESLFSKTKALDDSIAELDVMIGEKQDSIDWDELREYDPGEYLKQKELQEKRQVALKEAKSRKSSISDEDANNQAKTALADLVKHNPNWIKDGQETDAYKTDMTNTQKYLTSLGMSEQAQRGILTTGHGQVFIDAAKYHLAQQSNASVAKKVRLAPVVTKPGGARVNPVTKQLDEARAAHKKYGTDKTAFALRKALKAQ